LFGKSRSAFFDPPKTNWASLPVKQIQSPMPSAVKFPPPHDGSKDLNTGTKPGAPPTPLNDGSQFYFDHAKLLHQAAAAMKNPKFGLSFGQALVGVLGALATQNKPHNAFVSSYLQGIAQANLRRYGSAAQAWESSRRHLLDQAEAAHARGMALRDQRVNGDSGATADPSGKGWKNKASPPTSDNTEDP
jgi:hypothetical protein